MADPVALAPGLWVAGQIHPEQVAGLAQRLGLRRIINNRPDGEEAGQPDGDAVRAAAEAAGLDYLAAPVRGVPGPDAVAEVSQALASGAPTLMFCRSGMRSTALWALSRRAAGDDAATLRERAMSAGYDLSGLPL